MITIVDYNMGNLLSIRNILKKVGFDSTITSDPDEIVKATKLILPGVGAFDTAMKTIDKLQIKEALNQAVLKDKKPILGICLGMQLMCGSSEEGNAEGFNWINAKVKRFPKSIENERLRIPHIGWNKLEVQKESELFLDPGQVKFYFVHSYFVELEDQQNSLSNSFYGLNFCSAFQKENIVGVQFHPEKSHKFGMYLFKTFASANNS